MASASEAGSNAAWSGVKYRDGKLGCFVIPSRPSPQQAAKLDGLLAKLGMIRARGNYG